MHPVGDLQRLSISAQRRLDYLRRILPASFVAGDRQTDRRVAYVAIELQNTWAIFCRSVYLSSCSGARDSSGSRVSIKMPIANHQAAIEQAVWRFKPSMSGKPGPFSHRDEPNWADPNTLSILLNLVGASNAVKVDSALSLASRAFADLPSIRNFYAHRNQNTAEKALKIARHYSISSATHPLDVCLAYAPGRPQAVLADWVSEIRIVTELLV